MHVRVLLWSSISGMKNRVDPTRSLSLMVVCSNSLGSRKCSPSYHFINGSGRDPAVSQLKLKKMNIKKNAVQRTITTEANALCYPTTSVVSSQITIYMIGWSEVTCFHNQSPALPCPALPSPCLYLLYLCQFNLDFYETLNLAPVVQTNNPNCLIAIWGDYHMS